ncbi:MAG: response regulator [Deltaproteobacteria bacterium]|nr:response regulator [Deltaproteobacteria bacterium]
MSEKAKILFVDDEEAIRSLILTVLEGDGHTAHGVGTAAEAVQAVTDTPYDLVVIDKNLPDGSGIDLLRDLKRKHPETEFMILTGYPSLESAIEALRAGAFDYLIKPVLDLDLVTQKVSRALERRRLLQQAYRGTDQAGSDAGVQAQALVRQAGALRAAVDGGKDAEAKELAKAVDEAARELARQLGRG